MTLRELRARVVAVAIVHHRAHADEAATWRAYTGTHPFRACSMDTCYAAANYVSEGLDGRGVVPAFGSGPIPVRDVDEEHVERWAETHGAGKCFRRDHEGTCGCPACVERHVNLGLGLVEALSLATVPAGNA